MEQRLVVFERANGLCPFQEWLEKLADSKARAVIRARLERVRLGNFGNCRSVGDGVEELKIAYGPAYRVYFGRETNRLVILLCGGDKRTQKRDIERAKRFWKEHRDAD